MSALELICLMAALLASAVDYIFHIPLHIAVHNRLATRLKLLRRATANAQTAALKAQLDPHFLLNCINGLCHEISTVGAEADSFADELVWVYQYVLRKGQYDVVDLNDELEFAHRYFSLMTRRFGSALTLEITGPLPAAGQAMILPLALQCLLENAIKHNRISIQAPMRIEVLIQSNSIRVLNTLHLLSSNRPSTGLGLANLESRIRLLTSRNTHIERGPKTFAVTVPLIKGNA